jgi:hypothetical protein
MAFGPQIIQVAICLTWYQSLGLGFCMFATSVLFSSRPSAAATSRVCLSCAMAALLLPLLWTAAPSPADLFLVGSILLFFKFALIPCQASCTSQRNQKSELMERACQASCTSQRNQKSKLMEMASTIHLYTSTESTCTLQNGGRGVALVAVEGGALWFW